ncbi:hypothetical protein SDC9_66898 [bioreactor metagenome]|uniref:Uncharacterized protein n=1 Tax=bioreactor metagenome TaxID=1076179 RepID=A0A644XXF0_9ZZZZ|nr:hypothetical protein [Candidatus Metalachnospira sp.]
MKTHMKHIKIIICILICILLLIISKKPIIDNNKIPNYINIRYIYQNNSTNYTINDSKIIESLYDSIELNKGWFINEGTSAFFLGGTESTGESISLYSDTFAIEIDNNGTIWDIKNGKFIYLSFFNNEDKTSILYENILKELNKVGINLE